MEVLIFWFIFAIVVGFVASVRGRSGFGYFVLSVLLSPLLGLIIVLVLEDLNKKAARQAEAERDHQRRLEEVRALAQAPAAAAPASPSLTEELSRLAALRERGAIDDSEFQRLKAKLLGDAR